MQIIVFITGLIRGAVLTFVYILQMIVYYWFISIPVILCITFIPAVFRFIRAALARFHFVCRMRCAVRRGKGKVKLSRFPLASLFINNGKPDAVVDLGDESCVLKFFPGNPLNRKVYIHDRECVYTARRNAQALFGRGVRGRCDLVINKADTKMKKRRLKVNLSENKNTILLISPLPYEIYVYDGNQYRMTGNGERFNDMTIYTSNGFLDFLQRK